MAFKIDIHNHILPERWPDLKEVSATFLQTSERIKKREIMLACLTLEPIKNGMKDVLFSVMLSAYPPWP